MDSRKAPVKSGGFEPAPEGQHVAVCVDGIDMGHMVEEYDGKDRLSEKYVLVFQVDVINPETGKRYEITREFTLSMGNKANLRKFTEAWAGKTMTDEDAADFDLARLHGKCGLISVQHKTSRTGNKYGLLQSIAPLFKGIPAIKQEHYERAAYLITRKGEYAEAARKFVMAQGAPVAAAAPAARKSFDEVMAAADIDDLPF